LQISAITRNHFGPLKGSIAKDESHEETSYAKLPEDSIAKDESHEETRYAGLLEVAHTAVHLTLYKWEKLWQPGPSWHVLKGHVANSIFFDPLILAAKNRTAAALQ
jgi:hypothetical protein